MDLSKTWLITFIGLVRCVGNVFFPSKLRSPPASGFCYAVRKTGRYLQTEYSNIDITSNFSLLSGRHWWRRMSRVDGAGPRMARPKAPDLGARSDGGLRRLACDRCHHLKEKCTFDDGIHRFSCTRCSRLLKPCVTSRRRHGGGRPRKPVETPTQPQAGVEFVWYDGRLGLTETSSTLLDGLISATASTSDTLSQQSDQPENSGLLVSDAPCPEEPQSFDTPLLAGLSDSTALVNRTPQEAGIVRNMLTVGRDFSRPFVLGPSFVQRTQNSFRYVMYAAPEVMLSVHMAIMARWRIRFQRSRGRFNSEAEGTDYAHCARAVRTLRARGTAPGMQATDWLLTLMLGLCIITFDLLDSGAHAHSISRFTLGLLMQHLSRTGRPAGSAASTSALQRLEYGLFPLVFFDTWNSIVRREVPVCRFTPRIPAVVDRYLGLCGSLLPHLYDICCLSRDVGETSAPVGGDEAVAMSADLQDRYRALRNAVLLWEPSVLETPIDSFTPQEIDLMNMQVRIYRFTALLVLHRIRYPFGDRDEAASGLAMTILADLGSIYIHRLASPIVGPSLEGLGESPTVRGPGYEYRLVPAFLVAAVELVDVQQRYNALQRLSGVVCKQMYPNVGARMREFLSFVWGYRDGGYKGHWFDLARSAPSLVLF